MAARFSRLLRSSDVDFLGTFRGFGKDRDFVLENFGKPPRHSKVFGYATGPVSDDTHAQLANQWSMPRQDAQISVQTWNLCLFRGFVHHHFFRGDDLELESVGHFGR